MPVPRFGGLGVRVSGVADGVGAHDGGPPKAFHWKNGYHAAEHALVAMITTAGR